MRGLEACANGLVVLMFLNTSHATIISHDSRYVLYNSIFDR